VSLSRIIFVARKKDSARRIVDALDPQHFKITLGYRAFQLRFCCQRILFVKAVEIQMGMPVAPTRP
jgi:hypothetical protein